MNGRNLSVLVLLFAGAALTAFLLRSHPSTSAASRGFQQGVADTPARRPGSASYVPNGRAKQSFQVPTPSVQVDPADKPWLDSILLATQFETLMARASRDPAFSYSFSEALYACSRADSTYRNLQKRLANPDPRERLDKQLETADKAFAKCSGLTAKHLDNRYELLNRAAAAGVLEAQLNYRGLAASDITNGSALRIPNRVDEIRSNVEAVTVAAARTGDTKALYNAFALYSDGRLVEPNRVLAHRYLSDVVRVSPLPQYSTILAFLTSQMSPEELRRAQNR